MLIATNMQDGRPVGDKRVVALLDGQDGALLGQLKGSVAAHYGVRLPTVYYAENLVAAVEIAARCFPNCVTDSDSLPAAQTGRLIADTPVQLTTAWYEAVRLKTIIRAHIAIHQTWPTDLFVRLDRQIAELGRLLTE